MPKAIEETLDNVPEALHEFYTERNGKFEFTGVDGIRTQGDIDRLQASLQKERNDHRGLKDKFKLFGDLDIDDVRSKLDRFDELETAAAGKLDEAGLEKLVESRLRTRLNPVEREAQRIKTELDNALNTLATYQIKEKHRTVQDTIVALTAGSSAKVKVIPESLEDIMMYAGRDLTIDEDGNIATKDGLSPQLWLEDMIAKKPHWLPPSEGGGATGSGGRGGHSGPNPFSKDGWNMTEQGALVRTDPKKAEQLAKLAGTTVGGARPIK